MTDDRTTVTFDRREVVARLLRDRRDLVAVSSLGSATYDLAAAGDHDRNFYLWGAMGGVIPLALGLALAQPEIPVAALVGDGEALMAMGSFATVALQHPANLSIVILDNERYGETGGQLSHTASGVDLAGIARACGVLDSFVVTKERELEALAIRINAVSSGPTVAVVKIESAEKPRFLPSRDGVLLKTRLRAALGLEQM
jgi:thiamine pyrophosphate-dependent acetolactate synthase large subunit-like protein